MRLSARILRPAILGSLCLLLGLLAPSFAFAQSKPCSKLSPEDDAEYRQLGQQAGGAYGQKDYTAAIQYMVQAMDLCDEDPRTQYNLARAYHRANNCNMAMYWYERLIKIDPNSAEGKSIASERERAGRYFTEMQAECSSSARVVVDCSNPEVRITIGESHSFKCPHEGRLDAGLYKIRATLSEKHKPYVAEIRLVAGQNNRILIPKLEEIDERASRTTGTLRIDCEGDLEKVILRGEGMREDVKCGDSKELPPGRYTLAAPGDEKTQEVDVILGETYGVRVGSTSASIKRTGFFLGIRANPSMGLATGELLDENGDESFGQELDGLQPSLPTFAFNETLGIAGQFRLDFTNFSAMGAVVLRWVPWFNDILSFRVDVGGGAGKVVLPVELENGQIPLAKGGPGFAQVGLGLAWRFTDLMSFVSILETRVGFPEIIVPFDLSLGIEVLF